MEWLINFLGLEFFLSFFFRLCMTSFFFGGQKLVKKLLAEAFARQKKYLHSKTAEKKSCKESRFDVQVFFGNCPNPPPPYYLGVDIRNKYD